MTVAKEILPAAAVPLNLVRTACPLAPVHGDSSLHKIADTFGAGPFDKDLFEIHRCCRCGLGVTNPMPPPDAASALYADRTSNDFQPGDSGLASRMKAMAARRDAARFARYSAGAEAILDYACGNGAFTHSLGVIAPRANVYGSDYHEAPPEGLRADAYIPYSGLPERRGTFDLIVARHVLEHTYSPVQFLMELRDLTAAGGVIAIEVPALDTPLRHVFGRYWDGYYVPYHPLHFSRTSLRMAVESAGFEVLAFGKAEMPKIGRSLRNVTGGPYTPLHFAAGVALHPVQVLTGLVTGTSVCLRVWARKR